MGFTDILFENKNNPTNLKYVLSALPKEPANIPMSLNRTPSTPWTSTSAEEGATIERRMAAPYSLAQ